ncbi:MAG TPA: hypothetical protein VFY99_06590 [Solirubrobacterales bacterium]
MLLSKRFREGIAAGEISLAFRRWKRPRVKAGTRMRTASGIVEIDSVEVVGAGEVDEEDARRAGFASREALFRVLDGGRRGGRQAAGEIHRIELHHGGPDPRVALRERAEIDAEERAEIDARLARMDAASRTGPWTADVLALIAERPETLAERLAASRGEEKPAFKRRVRRLKELGLTESLEVGYRLSPRGRAYLGGR